MNRTDTDAQTRCREHFEKIYGPERVAGCMERLERLLESYQLTPQDPIPHGKLWDHRDQVLITYADMIRSGAREKGSWLRQQHRFLKEELHESFSTVHILPFFPSSSDDGFSVVDYHRVDEKCGSWRDIERISEDFRVMADLVINHVSRHSEWFHRYLERKEPWVDYFIEVDRDADLSEVTRPRNTPLLTAVQTEDGEKLIWSTFSDDQIDVNFKNPDLLFEYLEIFFLYLSKGIRVIRLDAVAYLWKEIGTSSIHLPQTHEVVRLFRTLVDHYWPDVTIITETNVPHRENISYFGRNDEAHMVYQFSLPPLLLHALQNEEASSLTRWAASLKPPPEGCTFFNFTSSHDGIGLRPLEGLVPEKEITALVQGARERGGYVSYKQQKGWAKSPYELNITWFDAFSSFNSSAEMQIRRFFCAELIMLSLQGVPGIYFHNLIGTKNYRKGVRLTGRHRTINRRKWDYGELSALLEDEDSTPRLIFDRYREILAVRGQHPAFHPFGAQKIHDAGEQWFVVERSDPKQSERILAVANVTGQERRIDLTEMGLPLSRSDGYENLLTGETAVQDGVARAAPFEVLWLRLS